MGKPIAASDLTWLLMDRPNNLMHVNGLLVFDTLPDFEAVQEAVFERVVTRYRVLSQHPVRRHGRWVWADDVPFELDRHLSRVVLPDGSRTPCASICPLTSRCRSTAAGRCGRCS